MACYGMVWYDMKQYGMTRYGMVRYGMRSCGMLWYGMVWMTWASDGHLDARLEGLDQVGELLIVLGWEALDLEIIYIIGLKA